MTREADAPAVRPLEREPGRPKHLLHVIDTVHPEAGGPAESVWSLLRYAPAGYTGEVVTLDDPHSPFLRDLPFPVHALGPKRSVYGRTPELLRWLREHRSRFDGAIVHGLWQYCGYASWRAFAGRVPYLVFPHGMLDPYFKHRFPLKHLKKWLYWLPVEYWVLRRATRVLFTTRAEEELAAASFWLHRWRGMVVSYGAAGPPPFSDALCSSFFERCPDLRGKRFLLFLGRIHRKKGCDLLIESFARIAASQPDLHLLMAGPDQQGWSEELQQGADEAGVGSRVHWPGMLQGDAKWGAFYAAEAFVLPSHQENFGVAVAEALACATPVLLSDQVNTAREIADDGAGLVEPDTAEGTLRLLTRWIAMPEDARATMRLRARASFERRYDMERNARAILQVFETAEAPVRSRGR